MNYEPIVAGTQSNGFAGTKASDNEGQARKETKPVTDYILLPLWTADPPFSQDPKSSQDDGSKPSSDDRKKVDEDLRKDSEDIDQNKEDNVNNTNNFNAASTNEVNVVGRKTSIELLVDPDMSALEDISIFDLSNDDEDVDVEADMNILDTSIQVSPIPTTRIHKDYPLDQVIGDLQSAIQKRRMSKNLEEHGFVSTIQQRTNYKDLQNCLFACFLSQEEPKKVIHALKDPSWIEAMQEELLQFKLQEVWTLVDLPNGKRAIGTKWVFRNKKDERGIVIRNKARLVAQRYIQEEEIDYDEVFAHVSRIEAIRLFLACVSFKDFVVYQMDVKSAFLYGKIEEEVYVCQPPKFEDLDFPDRVYKVHCMDYIKSKSMATVKVKTVNRKQQLHALVDGKKVIITESIVRRDIQLEDVEGVDCLPSATIFEQLALMGRVKSSDEEGLGEEDASKQGRIPDIDVDAGISLDNVEELCAKKKKDQISLDVELAFNLKAEEEEEERLAREKNDEANVALTEGWDDIQAKIEAGHELAQRLQVEEQEELSVKEKAILFQQLLEQRRKYFAAKSPEDKSNKPPTQAQQRKIMCTYLNNMEGNKLKYLKNKSFDSIQKMFDRAFKRVNTFVDFRTDLEEGSSKRAGEVLEQESTKKHSVLLEFAIWNDLHAGRKEISPYTTYNYRYAEQEDSGVNAASEEVSTVELVSTAYKKEIQVPKLAEPQQPNTSSRWALKERGFDTLDALEGTLKTIEDTMAHTNGFDSELCNMMKQAEKWGTTGLSLEANQATANRFQRGKLEAIFPISLILNVKRMDIAYVYAFRCGMIACLYLLWLEEGLTKSQH
ncbi:putative ribonuclease H-like domain-containing protein [Tanacetum coccineum]|uniref:Ribonuclease H-like domain-containing protein n=1 Tax=Tanacetum coccineum TaxID=301880 RepID=A0ABQ4ZNG5_9ASTR